jgi:hypothetical protein
MSDEQTQTQIADESQDQKYFTITPRLIWALSRNPFDYTLWATIKGIAGESGECFLGTADLAVLAMMSDGQVSESRKYLLDMKLLIGECRRDPGYPQKVWHLRIPNIWAANVEWATRNMALKDRVEFKRKQQAEIQAMRKNKRLEQASEGEKGLHQVKPSPGEGGVTYGEGGTTPGELKNIHKENQKEDLAAIEKTPPPHWGVAWQIAAGVEEVKLPTPEDEENARIANAVGLFAPAYQELVRAFVIATGIFPIKQDVSGWSSAFKDQQARTGLSADDVTEACAEMIKDNLTIKDPFSVMNKVANIRAKRKTKQAKQTQAPAVLDTPLTRALEEPFVPAVRPTREQLGLTPSRVNS